MGKSKEKRTVAKHAFDDDGDDDSDDDDRR